MAAKGEHYEWTEMYPSFEEQAKVDGDTEAKGCSGEVRAVEEKHEERYHHCSPYRRQHFV
jgi:rubrerythrin